MRVVVVGCGAIAPRWMRAIVADSRLTVAALVDPGAGRARALAEQHDLDAAVVPTLDQALVEGVEVAVNLTPPDLHATVSRAALTAGLHVLTEKPLATSLTDAGDLVRLADRTGRRLLVMRNRGNDPRFARFCELVRAEGRPPFVIAVDVCVELRNPGFRATQRLPVTTDLAVHAFDQTQEIITAPATWAHCVETPIPVLGAHAAITNITIGFGDGSLVSYRGGYLGPGLRTPANGVWRIDGASYAARWEEPQPPQGRAISGASAHRRGVTHLVDALHQVEPTAWPTTTLRSIAMLDAALASAVAGHVVPVAAIPDQP
ncbi:Gfo/Idh/MocA family oxidoreductase [Solwaraspora sp. WMMD1047]|uniref:Gfo/Idh/MocA family protein n=1 Tax=Solwaraspora sp. WMMD1047 TaxID=3016102 RepID=UPI0024175E09|nr:Gfo/Idh/MocA family oxidoreductase [Solwaraspora sp. WMMD1047]MDG4834869.1 Gfo/Idh/MocA family oxidoreductase [Solwaraspora sp. WMMD1047]